jgi:hypothetical protein
MQKEYHFRRAFVGKYGKSSILLKKKPEVRDSPTPTIRRAKFKMTQKGNDFIREELPCKVSPFPESTWRPEQNSSGVGNPPHPVWPRGLSWVHGWIEALTHGGALPCKSGLRRLR